MDPTPSWSKTSKKFCKKFRLSNYINKFFDFFVSSLRMSYRKRKHHRLESEIKHIVDKELRKNIELQHFNVYNIVDGGSSPALIAPDGVCQDLSQIPQGDAQQQRLSDVAKLKTLRIRLQIQSNAPAGATSAWKDGCCLLRYIIFSWIPAETNTNLAPTAVTQILDLLSTAGSSPGSVILAPHLSQGLAIQFRIHVDETISLQPSAGGLRVDALPYAVSHFFFSLLAGVHDPRLIHFPVVALNPPSRAPHPPRSPRRLHWLTEWRNWSWQSLHPPAHQRDRLNRLSLGHLQLDALLHRCLEAM